MHVEMADRDRSYYYSYQNTILPRRHAMFIIPTFAIGVLGVGKSKQIAIAIDVVIEKHCEDQLPNFMKFQC